MKITDLRHLDSIKGNFGILLVKDYFGSASVKEEQPHVELVRSNGKTFVTINNFSLRLLWNKTTVPAEQKIKEIEEGKTFKVWIRLIENMR